jgi:hypothetical protein
VQQNCGSDISTDVIPYKSKHSLRMLKVADVFTWYNNKTKLIQKMLDFSKRGISWFQRLLLATYNRNRICVVSSQKLIGFRLII